MGIQVKRLDVGDLIEITKVTSRPLRRDVMVSAEHQTKTTPLHRPPAGPAPTGFTSAGSVVRDESIDEQFREVRDIRIACNGMRTFAEAVRVAFGNKDDVQRILDFGEAIACRTLDIIGLNRENDFTYNLARVLPDAVTIAAEVYGEDPRILDDAEVIDDFASALAMAGAAAQSRKLLPRAYQSIDTISDIRISMLAASSKLITEIVLFRFSEKIEDDIRAAVTETMIGVKRNLAALIPTSVNEKIVIPLVQSTIRNFFNVMSACWRRQAAHASALPVDQIRKDAANLRAKVFEDFTSAITQLVELTVRYVADHGDRSVKESRAMEKRIVKQKVEP